MIDEYVQKWITLAEEDLEVAHREINFDPPITRMICFHCQQTVEKYLKSYLAKSKIDFPKTHVLEQLVNLCASKDESFSNLVVSELTEYAVDVRYPEDMYIPSVDEAKEAVKIAETVKEFILEKLNPVSETDENNNHVKNGSPENLDDPEGKPIQE